MPHQTSSLLNFSRTVSSRIIKFCRHIQADLSYIYTGYDVNNYFQSKAAAKKPSKIPLQTASGGIFRKRFKRRSSCTRLSETTSPTNVCDMTSLVTSGRLKNAIKYCTKVMRQTGPTGQRVKYFDHCLTKTHQISHGHTCRPIPQLYRI